MVEIFFDDTFTATLSQIKDQKTKIKIRKQIEKLRNNPEVGKPMRYEQKVRVNSISNLFACRMSTFHQKTE